MSHVFVSYVRENEEAVKRLSDSLRANAVEVWMDRDSIAPGKRWKQEIQTAIQKGTFFVACFSPEYSAKQKTYMNEELTIAIEELRQRPSDRAWFLPIKLSECEIPDRDVGAGASLRDIQWLDLSGDWEDGIERLTSILLPEGPRRESSEAQVIQEDAGAVDFAAEAIVPSRLVTALQEGAIFKAFFLASLLSFFAVSTLASAKGLESALASGLGADALLWVSWTIATGLSLAMVSFIFETPRLVARNRSRNIFLAYLLLLASPRIFFIVKTFSGLLASYEFSKKTSVLAVVALSVVLAAVLDLSHFSYVFLASRRFKHRVDRYRNANPLR